MKLAVILSVLATVVATSSAAESINITGASSPTVMQPAVSMRLASSDILDRATALLNKNALSADNNAFISRSNVVFLQNDRLAMQTRALEALRRGLETPTSVATLSKSMLRALAAPATDAALMTKARAVIATATDVTADPAALVQRFASFVDAVGMREVEQEQEQAIQSQTPRGVVVLVGTKDVLRQPTAVVNKNVALTDNQMTIATSNMAPQQNDQVAMAGGAKVANVVAPASAVNVGQVATTDAGAEAAEPEYRQAVVYQMDRDATQQEQWGRWGLGWGLGWRYPLGYWNTFGRRFYGGGCGLGFARGPFFYC